MDTDAEGDAVAAPAAAGADESTSGDMGMLGMLGKDDILLLQADVNKKLRELRKAMDSVIDVSALDATGLRVEVHRARQRASEAELALEQHYTVHGHTVRALRLQHSRMMEQVCRELATAREEKGDAERALCTLEQTIEEYEHTHDVDSAHIERMHHSLSRAGDNKEEAVAIIEDELRTLREQRDELQRELARAKAESVSVPALREQLQSAREQKKEALVATSHLESEMTEMLETIKRLEKERGDRVAKCMCDQAGIVHELQEKARALRECKAELNTLRTRMDACVAEHAEERAAGESELERLRSAVKRNSATVEDIRTAYEATKEDLRARTQVIADLEAQARAMESALAEKTADVNRMRRGTDVTASEHVRAVNEEAAALREECRETHARAEQATQQAHAWRERCARVEGELAAEKQRAQEALREWSSWSEAELQDARETGRLVHMQSVLRETDLRVSELQRRAGHDTEALRALEEQMRAAQDENARAQAAAARLRTQLEQVEEQLLAEHEHTARLGRELADKERDFMERAIEQERLIGNLQRRLTSERRRSVTLGEQAEDRVADRVTELEAALRVLQEKHDTVAAQRDTATAALDTLHKELAKVDGDGAGRAPHEPRSSLQVLALILLGMGALFLLVRVIAVPLLARTVPPPV